MFHLDSSSVVDCLHDRRSSGVSPSSFPSSLPNYEKAGLRDPAGLGHSRIASDKPIQKKSRIASDKPIQKKVISVTIRCAEEKEEEKNDGLLPTRPPTYSRKAALSAPSSIALGKTLGLDTTNQEITISYLGRKYSVNDGDLSMKEASPTTAPHVCGWLSQRLSKKGPLRKRLRDKFSFRSTASSSFSSSSSSETVAEKEEDDFQSDFLSHEDDLSGLSERGTSCTAPRSRHITYGEPLSSIFAEPEEESDETAETNTCNPAEDPLLESFPKTLKISTCDESVPEEGTNEQDDDDDPMNVDAQLFDEIYSSVSMKVSTTTTTTATGGDDSNQNRERHRFGHRLRRRTNQSQQPKESKPDGLNSSEIENLPDSEVPVVRKQPLDAGLGRSVSFEGPSQSDTRGLRKIFRGR